ncbi:hypothetical protein BB560_005208, partial [Smittium megazygosporum]
MLREFLAIKERTAFLANKDEETEQSRKWDWGLSQPEGVGETLKASTKSKTSESASAKVSLQNGNTIFHMQNGTPQRLDGQYQPERCAPIKAIIKNRFPNEPSKVIHSADSSNSSLRNENKHKEHEPK